MLTDFKDGFLFVQHLYCGCKFGNCHCPSLGPSQGVLNSQLDPDHGGSRFLSCFDSWLVVGVDIDQRRIQSDCPFKKSDQDSNRKRGDFFDCQSDRLAVAVKQSLTSSKKKALQVISRGNVRFDLNGCRFAVLQHVNKRHKKIWNAISKLLNISMLIRGTFVTQHRDTLM